MQIRRGRPAALGCLILGDVHWVGAILGTRVSWQRLQGSGKYRWIWWSRRKVVQPRRLPVMQQRLRNALKTA